MSGSQRPRVLSGIQPSGHLHLGNYLGALRNWVRDQDRYQNFFCIVDLHALTVPQEPQALRDATLELAAVYLAAGLDPQRCEIFLQSRVAAHSQLAWLLECMTPMGWLDRMTQFKQKSAGGNRERVGLGLYAYPCLMAADIVLYDADLVPVGDDQRQHVELCRDLVQRITSRFGDGVLKMPEVMIPKAGARVMGLDDPEHKMSKSLGLQNAGHAIYLLDSPDVIRRKVMRAKTDASSGVTESPDAGVTNLIDIHAACTGEEPGAVLQRFVGRGYGELKKSVAEAVIGVIEPIQVRYREFRDDPAELQALLNGSVRRVGEVAETTLARVETAFGLR